MYGLERCCRFCGRWSRRLYKTCVCPHCQVYSKSEFPWIIVIMFGGLFLLWALYLIL